MADLILGHEIYAPVFTVEWAENGEKIPREEIISVEIDEDLESPGMFNISFNERFDFENQSFKWLDNKRIEPGTILLISFGYVSAPKIQGLMRGKIKAISSSFLSGGTPKLSVEGYDFSHDLKKKQSKVEYKDVTYADVARKIAEKNKLIPDGIENGKMMIHRKIKKDVDKTDYEFLQALARIIGFEFFVRDRILYFRKPEDDKNASVNFEFHKNIISFDPRMSSANLVSEVRVTAWNEAEKSVISETAEIKDIESGIGIPDFPSIVKKAEGEMSKIKIEGRVVSSNEEAKIIALSELKKRNMGFITGTLECAGNPQLRPGITVNIQKVGRRLFSGCYYITKARHVIDESGYRTTLEVRRCL